MKIEMRNGYEMSAGKPERQNINVMCEDQSRLCSGAVQKCFFSRCAVYGGYA